MDLRRGRTASRLEPRRDRGRDVTGRQQVPRHAVGRRPRCSNSRAADRWTSERRWGGNDDARRPATAGSAKRKPPCTTGTITPLASARSRARSTRAASTPDTARISSRSKLGPPPATRASASTTSAGMVSSTSVAAAGADASSVSRRKSGPSVTPGRCAHSSPSRCRCASRAMWRMSASVSSSASSRSSSAIRVGRCAAACTTSSRMATNRRWRVVGASPTRQCSSSALAPGGRRWTSAASRWTSSSTASSTHPKIRAPPPAALPVPTRCPLAVARSTARSSNADLRDACGPSTSSSWP